MVATDRLFAGSIPEIYDRLLVPLIFDCNAGDLSDRLMRLKPGDILETAAGTGALTRAMAARLPAHTRIVATDLNQPMLDRAIAKAGGDNRIRWQQADALALPFADQSFDAVVCQFGVMFFPDKVNGFKEARRVLKPGGTFLFNAWDRISENAFVSVVAEELARMFPQDPPSFMARTPHGYHDAEVIGMELTAAGFTSITVEMVDHMATGATPGDVAMAYCQGTPLRGEIEARGAPGLEVATGIVSAALAKRFGNGPVEGRIRALVVSANR